MPEDRTFLPEDRTFLPDDRLSSLNPSSSNPSSSNRCSSSWDSCRTASRHREHPRRASSCRIDADPDDIYRDTARVPRGRTEDSVFRDDETLRVSNHLTPRVNRVSCITQSTEPLSTVATWIKDLNSKQLPAVAKGCDTPQNPATAGETGVVGRGGAAGPHGRTGRSGVNSNRPIAGRSGEIKFACDGTARFGTCGQNGEASGLVPEVLHTHNVSMRSSTRAMTSRHRAR